MRRRSWPNSASQFLIFTLLRSFRTQTITKKFIFMSPKPKSDPNQIVPRRMCKTKMAIDAAEPSPAPRTQPSDSRRSSRPQRPQRPRSSDPPRTQPLESSRSSLAQRPQSSEPPRTQRQSKPTFNISSSEPSSSNPSYVSGSSYKLSSDTSISSRTSLSSLRDSLPENPHIYDFKEICLATNNFLAKRYSSSSSTPSWRCTLRGKDVIIFQRKFRRKIDTTELRERLSVICRSHHSSIVKLLGASVSGVHIYLVYEFLAGANLADCLRNPRNPEFTVLSSWISRMQIATDLAHGLDYIHHKTGLSINLVHNHIKSSSIVVTEPNFNAKICHFGASQLCGEGYELDDRKPSSISKTEITEISEELESEIKEEPVLMRSNSRRKQFEGVMGYMSPEFQSTGVATQKSDVYAFGVIVLELLTGNEPLKYKFDKDRKEFVKSSLIESAMAVVAGDGSGGVEGSLRQWMDRRLKDSFSVDVAEKLTRVALDCVHVDPDKRPNMGRVAGKISKLYLTSKTWSDNLRVPTEITASFAPR